MLTLHLKVINFMLYISYQNFRSYLKFGATFAYYERRWLCLKYQFVAASVERLSSATPLLGPVMTLPFTLQAEEW